MNDPGRIEEALAPIVESFMERLREGERPTIDEYAARYPELAGPIRDLLPALIAVERDLSIDDGGSVPPVRPGDMPDRLGDYRVIREIGRGGMGVVYEAVQQSLGRHVALKVLPRSAIGPNSVERFRREARAAARLHHSNIVPVFGVGEDHDTHFFAMQFIRGQGLDQVVSEVRRLRTLPPRGNLADPTIASRLLDGHFDVAGVERPGGEDDEPPVGDPGRPSTRASRPRTSDPREPLGQSGEGQAPSPLGESGSVGRRERDYFDAVARIVLQIAEALAYAHEHGILHRDVKPANILLDTRGTAWVTDFGLARYGDEPGPTRTGDIIGTLRYMAPERFEGASDPRSDVYGLGATLYELLVLRPLFEDVTRPRLMEMILRREPTSPRQVDPRVPRDLEVICLKCLAKEPGRRYDSAERVAQELRRYLNGQTITARRSGSVERSYRWCRRNPALAGLLAALAASLILGVAGISHQWRQARAQRDEARQAAIRAQDEAARADAAASYATAARAAESATRLAAQRLAARTALTQGRSLADQGAVAQGMLWMAAALRETPPGEADFERLVRRNLAAYDDFLPRSAEVLPDEPVPITAQLAREGKILATTHLVGGADPHREGRFWDFSTGRRIGPAISGAERLFPSPDGRRAVALMTGGEMTYREVATGRRIYAMPPSAMGAPRGVAFSPDGRLIADYGGISLGPNPPGMVRLLDSATGAPVGRPLTFETQVDGAVFRPDGRALAISCVGAEVSLWEVGPEPRPMFRSRFVAGGFIPPLAFDPAGRLLAACWSDRGIFAVRFWDASTGRPLDRRITLGDQSAYSLAYSPDGRFLLTAEAGGVVRFWDASIDRAVTFPIVRIPDGSTVEFVRSGRDLLVIPDERLAHAIGADERPGRARLITLPEGLDLATAHEPGQSSPNLLFADRLAKVRGTVAADATGDRLIAAGWSAARIMDLESGLPVAGPIRNRWQASGPVAISREGSTVAAVSNNVDHQRPSTVDCLVDVRWLADGRPRCPPLHPANSVIALDISPDGRTIATGDFYNQLQLWDAATGSPIGQPLLQENIVASVAFSPDGSRVAVGTHKERKQGNAGVRIWDLARRMPVGPPVRHPTAGYPELLLWSADGSGVVSLDRLSADLMRIDGTTGAVTARASDFVDPPTVMIAGPDGRRLLAGTSEGTLELRDASSLKRIGPAMSTFDISRHQRGVKSLAFAPDGRTVAAGYVDGSVRLWDLATRIPIGPPRRHARSLLALIFRHGSKRLSGNFSL